jgi:C-terminal peptidase prc
MMSYNLKSIAGLAFAGYLSGCTSLSSAAPNDTAPPPPHTTTTATAPAAKETPTAPAVIYMDTHRTQVDAPLAGQLVAPIVPDKISLVSAPTEGLSPNEFEALAKSYLTLWQSANSASESHITKPKVASVMNGYLPDDLIKALSPDKEYSAEEISALVFKATDEMIQKLDPYSAFFPPVKNENFHNSVNGLFKGIGIQFSKVAQSITINRVAEGSPAEKAGLKAEDVITHGNGTSFDELTLAEVAGFIDQHQTFNFKINRNGEPLSNEISLSKGLVKADSVRSIVLNGEVARIKIASFTKDTHLEFADHVKKLQEQFGEQLTGIIIDLRGNGGGSLDSVLEIADYLVANEDLLYIKKTKQGGFQQLASIGESNNQITDLPLSVLIDNQSASASEILAGILQDYGRATIMGNNPSFGKATMQSITPMTLPDGRQAGLKLTNGFIMLPKTGTYQLTGIYPDILTPLSQAYKDNLIKYEGRNFEAENKNALKISDNVKAQRSSTFKCERKSDNEQAMLSIFNMQTQTQSTGKFSGGDVTSLCAIDHLTGGNAYSVTTKTPEQLSSPSPAPTPSI